MSDGNPWHKIKNEDYERHMGHASVGQLQVLSQITRDQLDLVKDRENPIVVMLGIANGNGLEHIEKERYGAIIGIDISDEFLSVCKDRYSYLMPILQLHELDLASQKQQAIELMHDADLTIANLLVEHIHLNNFINIMDGIVSSIVSVTIQVNPDGNLLSHSGHERAFDEVIRSAQECDGCTLISSMEDVGYHLIQKHEYKLPNGKIFVRLDFHRR